MNHEEQEELELIDFNGETERVAKAKGDISSKQERELRQLDRVLYEWERESIKEPEKRPWWKELLSWVITLGIAVAVAFILKNYVIINANVPTGSMMNTIQVDDNLFGSRLAYINKEPERGDIIIFRYPDDESQKYIKRVIGLPGETVVIEEGQIFINGSETPLQEDYLKEAWVLNNGPYTFDVPEGCFLVLGDNRNNSKDARFWKNTYVTKDQIIGEALFIYFPFSHMGVLE